MPQTLATVYRVTDNNNDYYYRSINHNNGMIGRFDRRRVKYDILNKYLFSNFLLN